MSPDMLYAAPVSSNRRVVDGRIRPIEEFNVPGRPPPGSGFTGQ
jgi:hypothetical protein